MNQKMRLLTMNKKISNSKGFSAIEMVVVIFIVGLVVFAGIFVYSKSQDNKTADNTTTQSQENASSSTDDSAPQVKSSDDLNSAEQFVDDIDVDKSLDTNDIDNSLGN